MTPWTRRPILLALSLALIAPLGCAGGGGGGGDADAASSSASGGGASATQAAASAYDEFAQLRAAVAGLSTSRAQSRLDAFITRTRASVEGFPLRRGTRLCFLWKGGTAQPSVGGTWNGWSASALPLARIGATDVWFAETDTGSFDRHEYKLVVGGVWRADPLNRKFAYGYGNSAANISGSGKSHLERIAGVRASRLANTRDVVIYLPPGYLDDPRARFPVLYMHDGQNVFDPVSMWGGWGADETLDALIAAPAGQGIRKAIVVAVANTSGRMSEYTHVRDDLSSRCDGSGLTGGRAADYADFLVRELKPMIDARYRTLTGRADTAILGSSLGGLVSLWTAYAHPQTFGMAGGMSSTLEWGDFCLGNDTMALVAARAGKQSFKVYLDSGGDGATSPDGDNWGTTEDLKRLLEAQGYVHGRDLSHWWEPGAPHNEIAWRARLEIPLRFFFGR